MECQVCTEKFTKMTRKRVTCPYCNYECCCVCAQTYVTTTPDSANCMNCKRAWTRGMLIKLFTKSFVNKVYREARSNVLFELERAMFPDTMPHVEHQLLAQRNAIKINDLRKERSTYSDDVMRFTYRPVHSLIPSMLDAHRIDCEIKCLEAEVAVPIAKEPARAFVQPCSRNGCNGFLSNMWKCRVCEKYTCKECHEPVEDGHQCDPNTVESVKQIKADSKQCPKCASLIYKIYGCDQMFCTCCQTAFSWRTGQIELGRIHNPHYYEYQRKHGHVNREIGDIQCGGMPDTWMIHGSPADIRMFHRMLLEFQQYHMPMYIINELNAFNTNLKHRVNFLAKVITEDQFKQELYRKDKDRSKKHELGMVSTTFVQIMSDLYNRYAGKQAIEEVFRTELTAAIEYCNGLFADVSSTYDCVAPRVNFPAINYVRV